MDSAPRGWLVSPLDVERVMTHGEGVDTGYESIVQAQWDWISKSTLHWRAISLLIQVDLTDKPANQTRSDIRYNILT